MGSAYINRFLHWKRDNSYIELMTRCQQKEFFLLRTALKSLNWIWRKLIESKISMSSTKFCVFRADQKTKMWGINVAHCTQVLDMWPFGPLVCLFVALRRSRRYFIHECMWRHIDMQAAWRRIWLAMAFPRHIDITHSLF